LVALTQNCGSAVVRYTHLVLYLNSVHSSHFFKCQHLCFLICNGCTFPVSKTDYFFSLLSNQIIKVLAVVVIGFYFSAATVAYTVLGIRTLEGSVSTAELPGAPAATNGPAPKAFSDELFGVFLKSFVLTGAVSIGATLTKHDLTIPLRTLFMAITTFFSYIWGARLPAAFCKICHPLVTSSIVTLIVTQIESLITGAAFNDILGTYKVGSINPMVGGAGDYLLYLLGPAVVSFAISIYSRKKQIVENFLVVCSSMMVGSAGSLFATAALVRLLKIGGDAGCVLRKSLLPRNVTTPLAVAITQILKGNVPQACAIVVFTGIYGATFGASFMTALGISDPVARGMGVGASGQGLGVASMMKEKEAFPFAAVSMVLTAIAATTLVSIPAFADALVKVSCGN
jgi:putative effector of murein hydrolase